MAKNIIILLDGTSNEISQNRSNIVRLYGTLKKDDSQVVYYDPGVGTFGAQDSWSRVWRNTAEIWGLATGWGNDQNVKQAYRFLVEHYQGPTNAGAKSVGDKIYIFGFSRGAYTARVLAGFIRALGLLDAKNLNLLDYAYQAYKQIPHGKELEKGEGEENPFGELRLFERMLKPQRPTIRCLGLFDTVASMIEAGKNGLPQLDTMVFTDKNIMVESVRHAVAIDERRTMFSPYLWPKDQPYWGNPFSDRRSKPQDINEVWFSGVHCDIGGGYPENKSALAKIPLHWMIEETKALGIKYITQNINTLVLGHQRKGSTSTYMPPSPIANANDSMTPGWKILEYLPRRVRPGGTTKQARLGNYYLPRGEPRSIPPDSLIHESVTARLKGRDDYRPPNLPADMLTTNSG